MKSKRGLIPVYLLLTQLLSAFNSDAQPVIKIAAGQNHGFFLKSDGSLWAMGLNNSGQLGDGTYNQTNYPEQIVSSNVTAIVSGAQSSHSLFQKNDGSLWAMGLNLSGQLGDGTYTTTNRPERIVTNNVTALAAGDMAGLTSAGGLSVLATAT